MGLTVDCKVTCGKVGFLGLGVVGYGCIGEIFCCVVVITVVTTSSFANCDDVRFSCCMRVEFKLLFPILSDRNEL